MKSLDKFPKSAKGFDNDAYHHDVRTNVAVDSPYNGEVGLELELEGRNLPSAYRGQSVAGVTWVAHEDGSLRAEGGNGRGGMEYVLSQPCARGDVAATVNALFEFLTTSKAVINNSTRCSTHVHVNAKGMKLNELAAFVAIWGTFEDVLTYYCGAHRSGNHFALRLSDSSFAVNQWVRAFQSGDFTFPNEYRYLALNPACLKTFGSLEVRTMRGVDNTADVVEWVNLVLAVRDAAKRFKDPTEIAATFSGDGSLAFADRVFGQMAGVLRQATAELGEDFEASIRAGFRRVQPIIYSLPWQAVLPEIERVYVPNPFSSPKKRGSSLVEAAEAVGRFN